MAQKPSTSHLFRRRDCWITWANNHTLHTFWSIAVPDIFWVSERLSIMSLSGSVWPQHRLRKILFYLSKCKHTVRELFYLVLPLLLLLVRVTACKWTDAALDISFIFFTATGHWLCSIGLGRRYLVVWRRLLFCVCSLLTDHAVRAFFIGYKWVEIRTGTLMSLEFNVFYWDSPRANSDRDRFLTFLGINNTFFNVRTCFNVGTCFNRGTCFNGRRLLCLSRGFLVLYLCVWQNNFGIRCASL